MHQHQTETICEWICCYGDPNNTTQVHVKFPWLINSRYTLAIYDLVSMNKVSVLLLDSSCESHWMGGKKMSEPYQSLYFGMFPICSFRGKTVLELRKVLLRLGKSLKASLTSLPLCQVTGRSCCRLRKNAGLHFWDFSWWWLTSKVMFIPKIYRFTWLGGNCRVNTSALRFIDMSCCGNSGVRISDVWAVEKSHVTYAAEILGCIDGDR